MLHGRALRWLHATRVHTYLNLLWHLADLRDKLGHKRAAYVLFDTVRDIMAMLKRFLMAGVDLLLDETDLPLDFFELPYVYAVSW